MLCFEVSRNVCCFLYTHAHTQPLAIFLFLGIVHAFVVWLLLTHSPHTSAQATPSCIKTSQFPSRLSQGVYLYSSARLYFVPPLDNSYHTLPYAVVCVCVTAVMLSYHAVSTAACHVRFLINLFHDCRRVDTPVFLVVTDKVFVFTPRPGDSSLHMVGAQ